MCLMSMSKPSCPACQDKRRYCFVADSTLIFYILYTYCLVPTSIYLFLKDAMQLPYAIQENNTPTGLTILIPVGFTVIIITSPAEHVIISLIDSYSCAAWSVPLHISTTVTKDNGISTTLSPNIADFTHPHKERVRKVDKAGERPPHQDTVRSSASLGWIPGMFCSDSQIE